MPLIAGVFALVAFFVAWVGFSNAVSDIQIILGSIGLFSGVGLFALGNMAIDVQQIKREQKRLLKEKKLKKPVKNSFDNMPDALEAFKQSLPGEVSHGEALKHLATDRLKDIGLLKERDG